MKERCKLLEFFHDSLWAGLGEKPGRPMAVIKNKMTVFSVFKSLPFLIWTNPEMGLFRWKEPHPINSLVSGQGNGLEFDTHTNHVAHVNIIFIAVRNFGKQPYVFSGGEFVGCIGIPA